ncbi:MAG: hypothetical protein ACQEQS_02235 [Thermodesulfobacteriota bacterium]
MYFPGLNPILQGLNSYYIRIEKLIEHFRGETGTGVIYFRGPVSQGTVFFESEYFMESFFLKNGDMISGEDAFELILENCGKNNYEIYIYYLEPEEVYLWSEVLKSGLDEKQVLLNYKQLEDMRERFSGQKKTGYIITHSKNEKTGIFFAYGKIIGYFLEGSTLPAEKQNYEKYLTKIDSLLEKTETKTDVFREKSYDFTKSSDADSEATVSPSEETINAMAEYILILDKYIQNSKKIKYEFPPLLKRKFMEHIDEYDFLDPFAAEFVYSNGKIDFRGSTDEESFVLSIVRCITEIINELNLQKSLKPFYEEWFQNYNNIINRYNIVFPF